MTQLIHKILCIGAMTAMSACGGGGSEKDDPPVQTIADLEGETVSGIATAQTIQNGATTTSTSTQSNITLGDINGTDSDFEVTFNDQTVTIRGGEGVLDNDQLVSGQIALNRAFSGIASVQSYASQTSEPFSNPIDGQAYYAFGQTTSRRTIDNFDTGAVTYNGSFVGAGQVDGASGVEIDGTIALTSTFRGGSDRINGTLDGEFIRPNGASQDVNLTTNLTFTGNSFDGALSCSGCNIRGTFFGPNGEELGGTMTLNTDGFEGSAGYTAAR